MRNLALALSLFAASHSLAALNQDGLTGVDHVFSAASAGNMKLGVSLATLVSNDERDLGGSNFSRGGGLPYKVDSYLLTSSQAALALGLGSFGEFSLALPFYYERLGANGSDFIDEGRSGDLQVRVKAELPIRGQNLFHLALVLGGSSPIAADGGSLPRKLELFTDNPSKFNKGSTPFGTGSPGMQAALGATLDFAEVTKVELRWHFNAGARKPNLVSDPPFQDILFGGMALEWGINTYLLLAMELYHESRFDSIGNFDTEPTTLGLVAAARLPMGFQIHAGAQLGLGQRKTVPVSYNNPQGSGADVFSMSTAPQVGIYGKLEWSGFLVSPDRDHDGIPNKVDKCPDQPEDLDGFEDQDGCPDLDDDKDGIPDASDRCPREAEDMDGFQDEDGCPDPDNDHDGVPDEKDKCPMDAQGPDGKDGCPNLDADNDGVPNISDKCPNDPEDKDGFEDEDGCPDPDNDKDGLCDPWVAEQGMTSKYGSVCKGSDKCPGAAETVNGFQDDDGCPDSVAVKTLVKEIVKTMILKGVNFRTGSAELTPESFSVLDGVVASIQQSPETGFEVSGHTDDKGNPVKNQMLSQARAQTVANYFIEKGVAAKRLKVMGYGSAKPITSNRSAEGRAMNRRVELNRLK